MSDPKIKKKEEQKKQIAKAMFNYLDAHLDDLTKVQLSGSSASREMLACLADFVIDVFAPQLVSTAFKELGIEPKTKPDLTETSFLSELAKI